MFKINSGIIKPEKRRNFHRLFQIVFDTEFSVQIRRNTYRAVDIDGEVLIQNVFVFNVCSWEKNENKLFNITIKRPFAIRSSQQPDVLVALSEIRDSSQYE